MTIKKHSKNGFTLVELIIVLVILAILIALLIPALTGYIDRANEKKVLAETRGIWTAAQAALSEQYAKPDGFSGYDTTFKIDGKSGFGRITDNALSQLQNGRWNTPALKEEHKVNLAVGTAVLEYLDSSDIKTATYKFTNSTNPMGMKVSVYEKTYGQPGINICFNQSGRLQFIEYGHSGYLATFDFRENGGSSPKITVEKDGTFSKIPN